MRRLLISLLAMVFALGMWAQAPEATNYRQGADELYQTIQPFVFEIHQSENPMGIMKIMGAFTKWLQKYGTNIKEDDKDIFLNVMMNFDLILPTGVTPGKEEETAMKTISGLRKSCGDRLSENFYQLTQDMNYSALKMEYTSVFDTLVTENYTDTELTLVMLFDASYRTLTDLAVVMAKDELRGILSAVEKKDILIGDIQTEDWKAASDELYKMLAPRFIAAYKNNASILLSENTEIAAKWINNHSYGIQAAAIQKMSEAQETYLPLSADAKDGADKTAAQIVKKYKKQLKNTCSKPCMQMTQSMIADFYQGDYTSVFTKEDTSTMTVTELFWLASVDAMLRAMKHIK